MAPIICSYPSFSIFYSFLTLRSCTVMTGVMWTLGPHGQLWNPTILWGAVEHTGILDHSAKFIFVGTGYQWRLSSMHPRCCRIYSESPLVFGRLWRGALPLTMWGAGLPVCDMWGLWAPFPSLIAFFRAGRPSCIYAFVLLFLSQGGVGVLLNPTILAEHLLCTRSVQRASEMISMTVKVSAVKGLFWWRREGNGRHPHPALWPGTVSLAPSLHS